MSTAPAGRSTAREAAAAAAAAVAVVAAAAAPVETVVKGIVSPVVMGAARRWHKVRI